MIQVLLVGDIHHAPSSVRTEIRDTFIFVGQKGAGGLDNVAKLFTFTVRKIPLSRLNKDRVVEP